MRHKEILRENKKMFIITKLILQNILNGMDFK